MNREVHVAPASLLTKTGKPRTNEMSTAKATILLGFVGLIASDASPSGPSDLLIFTLGPTVKDGNHRSSSASSRGRKPARWRGDVCLRRRVAGAERFQFRSQEENNMIFLLSRD